jgi:hypothetical protein
MGKYPNLLFSLTSNYSALMMFLRKSISTSLLNNQHNKIRRRHVMKKSLLLFTVMVFLCLTGQAFGADTDEVQSLYSFLAGAYTVVGKELNSQKTYQGKTVLNGKGDHLAVSRYIKGKTIHGIGKIETAPAADGAKVLRVRYKERGRDYEITYLWQSDLDNYARLSGYLYERGKQTDTPGLEVLFINHRGTIGAQRSAP